MTKLVHVQIVDGTEEEFKALAQALNGVKKKLEFPIEFLMTDDRVELRDIKYLIDELVKLYKKQKELQEKKLNDKNDEEEES